eukprot:CAMPEP_0168234324 /NCGR_PEP_ID=MMETSP0140_2-20121125/18197_1 /TAXON_ID=44445 /ORGANISM="Pseudo-nitzschia australis, Strain 10249 10 AB" /LENGTH=301 /DNA_ID=CAMNT_0008167093 /DNA_START=225 /DNA_END=1130 /DNA_ORIENTATION=+
MMSIMFNNTFNDTKSKDQEERISINSAFTFASLQRDDTFDGDELAEIFQNSMNNTTEASTSSSGATHLVTEKRESLNIFDGGELVNVFEQNHSYTEKIVDCHVDSHNIGKPAIDDSELIQDTTISRMKNPPTVKNEKVFSKQAISPSPFSISHFSTTPPKASEINKESNNSSDHEEDAMIEHIGEIRPYDIVCGRNNGAHNCIGNRRFRVTIMMNLKRYMDAPNREEKSCVIKSVIDLLTDEEEVGARFIKKVGDGMYVRLKERQIREKVGHGFREMIALSAKDAKKVQSNLYNNFSSAFR